MKLADAIDYFLRIFGAFSVFAVTWLVWYLNRNQNNATTEKVHADKDKTLNDIWKDQVTFLKEQMEFYKKKYDEESKRNHELFQQLAEMEHNCSEKIRVLEKRCNELEERIARLTAQTEHH